MFNLRTIIAALLLGAFCLLGGGAAFADDWVAVKLRGNVFAYVDGDWEKLARGDVVSDQRVVRTMPGGRVTFQRDAELIDVGPNTQIQIVDRVGRRYTTVKQYYGSVQIEAEVQNVQHFAVQTPYLAAVVKGTRFTVTSGKDGSRVVVQRGRVQVDSTESKERVVITAGQSAQTSAGGDLEVRGRSGQVVGTGGAPAPGTASQSTKQGAATGGGNNAGTGGGAVAPGNSGLGLEVGGGSSPVGVGAHVSPGGVDAGVNVGGVGAGVSVGNTSSGLGAAVEVGVPGTSGIGASVSTDGGGSPGGVSVQTPLGGIEIGLPLGL